MALVNLMLVRRVIDLLHSHGMVDVNVVIWQFYRRVCVRHHDSITNPRIMGLDFADSHSSRPYTSLLFKNQLIRSIIANDHPCLYILNEWVLECRNPGMWLALGRPVVADGSVTFMIKQAGSYGATLDDDPLTITVPLYEY